MSAARSGPAQPAGDGSQRVAQFFSQRCFNIDSLRFARRRAVLTRSRVAQRRVRRFRPEIRWRRRRLLKLGFTEVELGLISGAGERTIAQWLAPSRRPLAIGVGAFYGTAFGVSLYTAIWSRFLRPSGGLWWVLLASDLVILLACAVGGFVLGVTAAVVLWRLGERHAIDVDRALGVSARRVLQHAQNEVKVPLYWKRRLLQNVAALVERAERADVSRHILEELIEAARTEMSDLPGRVRALVLAHFGAEALDTHRLTSGRPLGEWRKGTAVVTAVTVLAAVIGAVAAMITAVVDLMAVAV